MEVVLGIVLVLMVLVGVVLTSRAEIEAKYERKGKNDRVTLRMSGLFGVVYHRSEISVLEFGTTLRAMRLEARWKTSEKKGEMPQHERRIESAPSNAQEWLSLARTLYGLYQDYRPMTNYILRRTKVTALSWQTSLGTGDAASTALLCGFLWSLKGTALGLLQSRTKVSEKNVVMAVLPSFKECKFQIFFQCILSMRVVHIIGAVYVLWREKIKRSKGVRSDGQSSDSRSDENSDGKYPRYGRRQHHCG